MKEFILKALAGAKLAKKTLLIALIDPDRLEAEYLPDRIKLFEENGVDFIFIGGSLSQYVEFDSYVKTAKLYSGIPVIGFPGSINQISSHLDALLFLSVISGRNADTLIGRHVQSAPLIKKLGIDVISTGYMLVESGKLNTAHYISHSLPIPRLKPSIAVATALAGAMLGLDILYMDAGSGAELAVPSELIEAVTESTSIPLLVGGGIRTPEQAKERADAGAAAIVIGSLFEQDPDGTLISEMVDAVHLA